MIITLLLYACTSAKPAKMQPAKVRLHLPPETRLSSLVALAERLRPDTLVLEDRAALDRQSITVRCDEEVSPDAVWLAMETALAINGWSLRREGDKRVAEPTPELWYRGDRTVDLLVLESIPAEEIVRAIGLGNLLISRDSTSSAVEVYDGGLLAAAIAPAANTLIVGGNEEWVDGIRRGANALSTHPELLGSNSQLLCPESAGFQFLMPRASSSPLESVRLNFPPTSLWIASRFFCDLGRYAVVVPDRRALEQDTFTIHTEQNLSVAASWRVYEHLLAIHGWTLQSGEGLAVLAQTDSDIARGDSLSEILALQHLTAHEAMEALGARGQRTTRIGRAQVDVLPDTDLLIVGGAESDVAAVRERLAELDTTRR